MARTGIYYLFLMFCAYLDRYECRSSTGGYPTSLPLECVCVHRSLWYSKHFDSDISRQAYIYSQGDECGMKASCRVLFRAAFPENGQP